MANQNDTAGARVVGGHCGKLLGARERVHEEYGHVIYAEGTRYIYSKGPQSRRGGPTDKYGNPVAVDDGGTKSLAVQYGLPEAIRGNPLGCGCGTAYLAGATPPVDSHIEADYMCDSGWHNFVVFELIGFENKGESQIKLDVNGNLIEDTKTQAKELGEF